MYWTLELASSLDDAPFPATKEELIDYATRTCAPDELIWCTFDRSDMFTQEYSSGKLPRSPSNYGPGVLSYFSDHRCIPLVPQGALLPSMVNVFLDNLGTDVLK